MNAGDKFKFIEYLEKLYPGKYTDGELQDFADRVQGNALNDCIRAIDSQRNTSRFKPTPADILASLRKTRSSSYSKPIQRDATFAEQCRQQWSQAGHNVAEMDDLETILRYYRGNARRYRKSAACRQNGASPEIQRRIKDGIDLHMEAMVSQCLNQILGEIVKGDRDRVIQLAQICLIEDECTFQNTLAAWRASDVMAA